MPLPPTICHKGIVFQAIHPAIHPLTPVSDNTVFSGGISRKLGTNIHCIANKVLKIVSQISKVKVICVQMCECYKSRGIHFVGVALYKYWLVPRSTLKNYALKLCNVAWGPKARGYHCTTEGHNFSVLIEANSQYLFCYIMEISILHSALPAYSNP